MDQVLLFAGKVVGDKRVAMRFDHFQITAERNIGGRERADGRASAVAQGDGDGGRPVIQVHLGCSGGSCQYLDFRKVATILIQADGEQEFRRPASQAPVGSAFGKPHSVQTDQLPRAEPVTFRRHIRFGLFQPIDIHVACPWVTPRPFPGTWRSAALSTAPRQWNRAAAPCDSHSDARIGFPERPPHQPRSCPDPRGE